MPGCVFVTVGTTQFDKLVQAVTSPDVCTLLQLQGYDSMLVQLGAGTYEPDDDSIPGFSVTSYRYKDSLEDDMSRAQLVISHAGAGSVLEALGANKRLVVVVNSDLMGNHQLELAQRLGQDKHLVYTTPGELLATLRDLPDTALTPFTAGEPHMFATFLDKVMKFS